MVSKENRKINEKNLHDLLDSLAKSHAAAEIKRQDESLSGLQNILDYVCGRHNKVEDRNYKEYRVDGHQQRFNMPKVKPHVGEFIEELDKNMPQESNSLRNFEEPFDTVCTHRKPYIGGTALYDFSLRYAWNEKPELLPEERVYLHSIPVKSAVLLIEMMPAFPKLRENRVNGSWYLPFNELPDVFAKNGLKAKDVEHLFCCAFQPILNFYNKETGQDRKEEKIGVNRKHINPKNSK